MDTVAVSSSFCVPTTLTRERPPAGLSTNNRHHLHLEAPRPIPALVPFQPSPYPPQQTQQPQDFLALAGGIHVEETYVLVKPDGVQRGLVGEVISRFERKGFKLTGLKLFQCPRELAEEHYKDLQSKPFFPKLIDYITSGPVVCMVDSVHDSNSSLV